jgi:hypothetical protein
MPLHARPVIDERDGLLTFLAQQRNALRASVGGQPPPASYRLMA